MGDERQKSLRSLPSVSELIAAPELAEVRANLRDDIVIGAAREAQERARKAIMGGELDAGSHLAADLARELSVLARDPVRAVINATGVIVHTNLGRAPVSAAAAAAMAEAAANYLPLEMELETGARGGRGDEVDTLMRALIGAERTLVVNNNAAAVTLVLAAVAAGRGVVVSRGEAVEIGGGFRIPDVLRQSGARLIEVGTTNRTYRRDYEHAIDETTAALLKVHASNFLVLGFTAQPSIAELAALAHERGILALEDVGSGCLIDTTRYGLSPEPMLAESLTAGADLVMASGDKLLGGPQAGLILGRAEVVEQVARHPLARALRADKSALAGLAATLRHYLRGEAEERIPVWWSISRSPDWLRERVEMWMAALGTGEVRETEAVVGGGALPGRTLTSFALTLKDSHSGAAALAKRLRLGAPAVVARVEDEAVLVDARTVLSGQDDQLVRAISAAMKAST